MNDINIERLRVKLYDKINTWVEGNCDSIEWEQMNIVFGDTTIEKMTDAAMSVFEAIIEHYDCLVRDDYIKSK